ncbi:hypothetical protein V1291_003200 [Nitrobacteraceae bacterium AZCC 1564]
MDASNARVTDAYLRTPRAAASAGIAGFVIAAILLVFPLWVLLVSFSILRDGNAAQRRRYSGATERSDPVQRTPTAPWRQQIEKAG